ncbi:MAG: response regulator [Actinomycetota bacterium]
MKVLVVDDNPIMIRGMRALLTEVSSVVEVLTAVNGQDALIVLEKCPDIDVVCLDVRMPLMDGISVVQRIGGRWPVIMLTHSDDRGVIEKALDAGARGYLVHGTFGVPELTSALLTCRAGGLVLGKGPAAVIRERTVSGGPLPGEVLAGVLTEREGQIANGVARGLSNAQVGRELFLSEKTVKNNLNRIYAKVGVRSRTELVAVWHGTVPRYSRTKE